MDAEETKAPSIPNLVVQRFGAFRKKVRKIFLLSEFSPRIHFRVHNSTISNLERALAERVFFVKKNGEFQRPPQPKSRDHFEECLRPFWERFSKVLPSTTPIPMEEFPLLYTGRKRTVYENAVKSLQHKGVERRDSYLKAFIKAEKTNTSAKPDPVPRVIQPRDPRYNVAVGRFIKPLESLLYKAIAYVFGEDTVAKGMNAKEIGTLIHKKWSKFRHPVAIGLDASRFDQHVSVIALMWEHKSYLKCYKGADRKELLRLLAWQIYNRGFGYCNDGKLKYNIDGCRMSGDMNTALGNCIIMCALIFSYCASIGLKPNDFELVNNGDDCVVIMEEKHLAKFIYGLPEWFDAMGFTMEVEEPVYELEHIVFCQCQPVYDGTGYVMVRQFPLSIAKDCVSIKPLDSEMMFYKWANAIGGCGLALTSGIPIVQSFYLSLLKGSQDKVMRGARQNSSRRKRRLEDDPCFETGMFMLAVGMEAKSRSIVPESRLSFWMAFGITPDQQEAIEEYYQNTALMWDGDKPMAGDIYVPWWLPPERSA